MNDRFLEELKHRVDLIEVVKKYAEVKKAGKNFVCKSPFRNEKTPSFSISPEKQMWYDFGSSEGGDAISFIEKIENYSFKEAVEYLADMGGVEIPSDFELSKGPSKSEKLDIFKLHDAAVSYFAKELQKSKKALLYCDQRGISKCMISDWKLGFGGIVKDGLTKELLSKGFSVDQIAQSGVSFERSFGDKGMMDRFAERLMIPIFEPKDGAVIAFSGREIMGKEKVAKYINSPENPVYHKSSTLFGLDRARKSILKEDGVILVEGNFDVIFAHDAGFTNVVATCGTSLTEDHLRTLKRLTRRIYLAFDNDVAGKKAMLRSVEMCLKAELDPFIVPLEGVKDFGELLEKEGGKKILADTIAVAPEALSFFLDRFSAKLLNAGSVRDETQFLDRFFYFLNLVTRPLLVDDFLTQIAIKLNRPKAVIEAEFLKFKQQETKYKKPKFEKEVSIRFSREESFVGFLKVFWDQLSPLIKDRESDFLSLFSEPIAKSLVCKLFAETELSPDEARALLAWEMYQRNYYMENVSTEMIQKEFQGFVGYLKSDKIKKTQGRTPEEQAFIENYRKRLEK